MWGRRQVPGHRGNSSGLAWPRGRCAHSGTVGAWGSEHAQKRISPCHMTVTLPRAPGSSDTAKAQRARHLTLSQTSLKPCTAAASGVTYSRFPCKPRIDAPPATPPCKSLGQSSRAKALGSLTRVGGLEAAPGSWLQSWATLAVPAIWEAN